MSEITIYTNEQCPYCKQIKEELNKNNIEFEERLTKDYINEWQEIANLTGMPTVPTILYDEEYLVAGRDFQNPQQLVNILQNFKSSSFDDTRKTLERIKTLNFHINTAFGKMDQLLKQIEQNYRSLFEDEETKTE